MKIAIAGGTGQVGEILARAFHARGDELVVLSRHFAERPWRGVHWDGRTSGDWVREVEGADVVINLAGRSVNCRYTPANRKAIMDSRVESTRAIGAAIQHCQHPPRVWLQASTATIYAHRFDSPNDENGMIGGTEVDAPDTWRFSIAVANAWEAAVDQWELPSTRKVKLRSAMILSPDPGGIFDTLLALVRRGLGGTAGSGAQYISWIHERDFVRAIDWLINHAELHGAVNIAAPQPLPNREFMRVLREVYGTPIGLPATEWMLEIGAFFMRTETELILKSRRVVANRLAASGFEFEFPAWRAAAVELCARCKQQRNA
jgi:uncharacterized protein (TIGR01777 family)